MPWQGIRTVRNALSHHPKRRRDRLLLLLVVMAAVGLETLVAALLWQDDLRSIALGLGMHIAFLTLLGLWIRWRRRQHLDTRVHLLLALTCAGLGIIGAAGTLIALAVIAVATRRAQPFEVWYSELAPKHDPNDLAHLLHDIESGRENATYVTQIEEFSTVLAHGAYREKQAVLSLISRNYRPEFAFLLREALGSADASLRVQAATAIEKVEAGFTRAWVRLQAASVARSQDYNTQLRLALHLDQYADSGLLEPPRDQQVRERALQAFKRCAALRPDDPQARLGLTRSLLRCGQHAQAIDGLRAVAAAQRTAEEWWCLAEALFQMRAYEEMRRVAREAMAVLGNGAPQELRAALCLWVDAPVQSMAHADQSASAA